MSRARHEHLELDMKELEKIIERAELDESDRKKLKAAIETLAYVTDQLEHKQVSIRRLRKLLFGASTEKTKKIFAIIGSTTSVADAMSQSEPPSASESTPCCMTNGASQSDSERPPKNKPKGHGRNAASSFRGAEKVTIAHESLHHGDRCPKCDKGKVYRMQRPKTIVRITGQSPIAARLYELETLRCGLCGEVFVARAPPASEGDKYDARAAAMIGVLKYGAGMPFHRLEKLQAGFGIPLPATTQWDNAEAAAARLEPAYSELIEQAAQGEVLHNDDTTAKIKSGLTTSRSRSAQACSPRESSPPSKASGSRCSSQGTSTRARISSTCSRSGPPSSVLQSRCATRSRATCPNSSRRFSPTASLTAAANLRISPTSSRPKRVTWSKSCAMFTAMMRPPRPGRCPPSNASLGTKK
jgi:transposase